jgi:hypothetical protein
VRARARFPLLLVLSLAAAAALVPVALAQGEPEGAPPPAPPATEPGHGATAAAAAADDSPAARAARLDLERIMRPPISPTRAVLATPLFPGWGQLYGRSSWRAAAAFGVQMYYWSHLLMNDRKAARARAYARELDPTTQADLRAQYDAVANDDWERMRDFAWWSFGAMLIIAVDAYVGAHLFRFEEDPVPVPDLAPAGREPAVDPGPEEAGPEGLLLFRAGVSF